MTEFTEEELPGMPAPLPPPPPPEPGPIIIKGKVTSSIDVKVDLVNLILKHQDEYHTTDLEGMPEFDRPILFVAAYLTDDAGGFGMWGTHVDSGFDMTEFNEHPSWSKKMYDELCEVCPEAAPRVKPEPIGFPTGKDET